MFILLLTVFCVAALGLIGLVLAGKFPLNGYPMMMLLPLFLIFVVNALQLYTNGFAQNYLEEWMFAFTTLIVLVSFLAVLGGWSYGDIVPKAKAPVAPAQTAYSLERLFTIGTVCHLVSLGAELIIASKVGGLLNLYSRPHSFYGSSDSDYIYLLFNFTFIGAVPYLQCLICDKNLSFAKRSTILLVLGLQILRALIVGQRFWVLNLLFIYVTVPFFCIQKWPRFRQILPFVLPAVLLVIIFPAVRGVVYIGSKNLDQVPERFVAALQTTSQGNAGSGIVDESDNSRVASEFILGAGIISSAWAHNSYTFGVSFYEVLYNPIPRQFWPEKPKNMGLKSWIKQIDTFFPWSFNNGSAPTGIADVFLNLGFLCIPFWFFFGKIHRWAYDLGSQPGNYYFQGIYVALLLGTVILLTQGILLWGTNLIASLISMAVIYSFARIIRRPISS